MRVDGVLKFNVLPKDLSSEPALQIYDGAIFSAITSDVSTPCFERLLYGVTSYVTG